MSKSIILMAGNSQSLCSAWQQLQTEGYVRQGRRRSHHRRKKSDPGKASPDQ
ncbi:hypothetical protein [Marinobacter xestospongiae]|uniref:hypothetical protein n=1 Tax=Marinobacter xestospongiae TaxID=994319 RepID=UPI0020036E17|nr:hypothetical protein [Marinobacter xestospongiae]MCK7566446.1 hypothetical protein [Marinobacter xestospongiae]